MTTAGLIGLLILSYMVTTILLLVYVSWRYLSYIESLMPRSLEVISARQAYAEAGMPGKMIRLVSICMMLASSKSYIKRGLVDAEDIRIFPITIKRRLIALLYSIYFMLGLILASSYFWPK